MPLELAIVASEEVEAAEPAVEWRLPATDHCWVDTELRWLVEAYGLDRFEQIDALCGEHDRSGHDRMTAQSLLAAGQGEERVVQVKLHLRNRWHDRLRSLLGNCPLLRELAQLRKLAAAGIVAPMPIAFGRRTQHPRCAWLVTTLPPGAKPLDEYLDRGAPIDPAPRFQLFAEVGSVLARLHAAGFVHGQLDAARVMVCEASQRPNIVLCEVGRSRGGLQATPAQRIGDLAGLLATLSPRRVLNVEKSALVDAYFRSARWGYSENEFRALLAAENSRRLDRQATWQVRTRLEELVTRPVELGEVEPGRLWLDSSDRQALTDAGLSTFSEFLETDEGRCLRALDDRENWIVQLRRPQGGYRAYLKKHHVRTWKTRLRARLKLGPGETAGKVEAENIRCLAKAGIRTMRLIAFGEKLHDDGRLESFVLTEELLGFQQLDNFLRARFPVQNANSRTDPALRGLIDKVAAVARTFHRIGFNHRDLYCCHFFVREAEPSAFAVHLIDLQRVQFRRTRRRRWIVKDLAQLAYSAPRERIGCRERVAFLHAYFRVRKLQPEHKRIVRRVLLKQKWMERVLGLHP